MLGRCNKCGSAIFVPAKYAEIIPDKTTIVGADTSHATTKTNVAPCEEAKDLFELGRRYASGTGILKNHKVALSWFRKAAQQRSCPHCGRALISSDKYGGGVGECKECRIVIVFGGRQPETTSTKASQSIQQTISEATEKTYSFDFKRIFNRMIILTFYIIESILYGVLGGVFIIMAGMFVFLPLPPIGLLMIVCGILFCPLVILCSIVVALFGFIAGEDPPGSSFGSFNISKIEGSQIVLWFIGAVIIGLMCVYFLM